MGQIVGAYAVLGGLVDTRPVVDALAASPSVEGLEVPFRGGVIEVPAGAPESWRYVVTLIPETMQRVGADSTFGLASPDPAGRDAALDYVRQVHAAVTASDLDVIAVELHSAPPQDASVDAFTASLNEIAGWEWGDTQLVIEHSDAWTSLHPVEKGFLTLADELDAAEAAGVGVSINWARSVIETREAATGLAHVREAAARGLLRGLMLSSVSPVDNDVSGGWIDAHLAPTGLSFSPEGSLLTPEIMTDCGDAAGDAWRGFKISVPPSMDAEARAAALLEMVALVDERSR